MKNWVSLLLVGSLFASCNNYKLVVMSKGEAKINAETGSIASTDGAGHTEQSVATSSKHWTVESPAGKAIFDLSEKGLYVVNAKNDTIIGSYQNYVSAEKAGQIISQEMLAQKLDSLKQLAEGKNVSDANRNFYILPNQAVRVTGNVDAEIVGPYHKMTSAASKNGETPEVYRFYSIKEIRETIGKLEELTSPVVK
ncbi:MAG: hypothetical protein EBX50_05010 [Chitinophagia bacterium]|nr:hypothetical protein [Chitinophagia bacterium]